MVWVVEEEVAALPLSEALSNPYSGTRPPEISNAHIPPYPILLQQSKIENKVQISINKTINKS